MLSPILRDRYSTIAGCQCGVGLAQFLEQASGKAEFRQRRLELIIVLELFALLRSHIGLEKDFARVIGLGRERNAAQAGSEKPARRIRPIFFIRGRSGGYAGAR